MSAATPDSIDEQAELFRILGHPLRLGIISALKQGERAVGELAEQTGLGLSALSQQLALLRKAGLVQTRREAKQIFYTLDSARLDMACTYVRQLAPIGQSSSPQPRATASIEDPGLGAAMFARVSTLRR